VTPLNTLRTEFWQSTVFGRRFSYAKMQGAEIPSWVGAMRTSQRAVTPCGCGVKAGMVSFVDGR